jgi:hypothetical protein
MKKLLMIAGLGVMIASTPVMAKDHGDHGRGYNRGHHEDRYDRDEGRRGYNRSHYACPPGLAKKHNGCQPPGHAKSHWRVGQRLPTAYQNYYVPQAYRSQYDPTNYRYYDGYVHRVDPKTEVIQQVIQALLR